MITTNKTHCAGNGCPSKNNCHNHTVPRDHDYIDAALYVRREAGANACDMFDPVKPVTTFLEDV